MTPTLRTCLVLGVLSLVLVAPASGQAPVGSAFTYQGQLNRTGQPVNGLVDFGFGLFDVPDGGGLVAAQVNLFNVEVVNGRFSVQLDFGPEAFDGAGRWLGILVRFPAGILPQ